MWLICHTVGATAPTCFTGVPGSDDQARLVAQRRAAALQKTGYSILWIRCIDEELQPVPDETPLLDCLKRYPQRHVFL